MARRQYSARFRGEGLTGLVETLRGLIGALDATGRLPESPRRQDKKILFTKAILISKRISSASCVSSARPSSPLSAPSFVACTKPHQRTCLPLLLPPAPARTSSMPQRLRSQPRSTQLPPPALTCTRDLLSLVPSAAPLPTAPSHPSMCTFARISAANGSQ
jgi:hypothetical protein